MSDLTGKICHALENKKGENIKVVDVRETSGVTDYYVIASGSSPPHLKAMFGEVQHVLKKEKIACYRKAGSPECGWMVLDYIDVIVHIFSEEARRFYAIEEIWTTAQESGDSRLRQGYDAQESQESE
ncbi:ribosome silencing factor [Verrucomicrobiota bacterium]